MTVLFVEYPKCSTCKKAKAWLDEHGVEYIDRDIVTDNPTADELATWIARSGLPLRRFFNSSGMKYRELGLKARLDAGMTDQECCELLATDGMLVKRPLLVGDDFAIPGFREAAWTEALLLRLRKVRPVSSVDSGMCFPVERSIGKHIPFRALILGHGFRLRALRESGDQFELEIWDALSAGGPAPVSPPAAPIRVGRRSLCACRACRSSTLRP